MGSPFTALLCAVIGTRVDGSSRIGAELLAWTGDPSPWADGLPLRLCGGLHALARSGTAPDLAALYPPNELPDSDTLWSAVGQHLRGSTADLAPWLQSPPQTNEVGRSAALMGGLAVIASRFQLPMALHELGASAGLNLLLDHFAFDLGGRRFGDPGSRLMIRPDWTGGPPPAAEVKVASRAGVDRAPTDPVAEGDRLLAYVWADQAERIAQLEAALAIAAVHPPPVERADAADWVEAHVPVAGAAGLTRVILHSIAWQYFSEDSKERITARMEAAGAAATTDAPVAWLRFERNADDREVSLRLRLWPHGEDRLLGYCHPHARWIDWRLG